MVVGLAGCITTDDYARQNERINTLQLEVRDLKEQAQLKQMEMERQVDQTNSNVPELRQEVEQMRSQLQKLNNAVEITEERGTLPGGEIYTLRDQLNHIRARLDRLETKLKLPPLSLQVVEAVDSAERAEMPDEPTTPIIVVPDETVPPDDLAYGTAKDLYKNKNYAEALALFRDFLVKFPDSQYASSAQFYVGESLYNERKYEESILEYQKVVKTYPKSNSVSIALLKQAYAFLNIGDKTSAKLLLQKVIREFPQSYSAGVAKKKLPEIQ
jgi:tol-pal system protein YbgF